MDKSAVKNQLLEMIKNVYHKAIVMEQKEELTQAVIDTMLADIEKLYKQAVLLSYWSPVEVKATTAISVEKKEIESVAMQESKVAPIEATKPFETKKEEIISATINEKIEVETAIAPTILQEEKVAPTINETEKIISQTTAPTMATGIKPTLKPGKKVIPDLTKALSLNERFQLNNQLFKGNMEVFNEAINKLNSFPDYSQAESYLVQLKNQYQWKDENSAFILLSDLVMCRYA